MMCKTLLGLMSLALVVIYFLLLSKRPCILRMLLRESLMLAALTFCLHPTQEHQDNSPRRDQLNIGARVVLEPSRSVVVGEPPASPGKVHRGHRSEPTYRNGLHPEF